MAFIKLKNGKGFYGKLLSNTEDESGYIIEDIDTGVKKILLKSEIICIDGLWDYPQYFEYQYREETISKFQEDVRGIMSNDENMKNEKSESNFGIPEEENIEIIREIKHMDVDYRFSQWTEEDFISKLFPNLNNRDKLKILHLIKIFWAKEKK